MENLKNYQDTFLNECRRDGIPVTVYITNGFQLRGNIAGYDAFAIVLESDGKQQLIYKHAISTITPGRRMAAV